jgi:hypothetical protein
MSNFVSLEDAAKRLGVTPDELVEMRSRGEIFGYRAGSSWQFKPEEIERVASELMGDALDEDPAGSSILMSGSDLGLSNASGIGSDVAPGAGKPDSDVELVAGAEGGSDVRLVASQGSGESSLSGHGSILDEPLNLPGSDDDDEELSLALADDDDLVPQKSGKPSSDVELGDDLLLSGSDALDLAPSSEESNVISESGLRLAAESDLIRGDSDPAIDSLGLAGGSDLELADDDLVLGGGSDLALGGDSGINLMSPSDSGISLEDEPLDLAASGISGLDLAVDAGGGSSVAGSGVDFQQDEEFQLSPSGSLETDDDSGSQVIELEDSSDFGDAEVALPAADGFDAFADVDPGVGGLAGASGFEPAPAATIPMGTPEVPYNSLQVLALLGILLLMCLSGLLVTDVVRNMWSWSNSDATLTSGFTEMVLSAFGMKR